MPKLVNISDEDYFSTGEVDILNHKDLIVSNSLLKQVFQRGLFDVLLGGGQEISDELQIIFDVGSSFHAFILEGKDVFDERYYVAEIDNALETRVRISKEDYEFITKSYDSIKLKYPELLDGESVELALFGEIDGVKTKSKFDKLVIYDDGKGNGVVKIIDLKSTFLNFYKLKKNQYGESSELKRKLMMLDYDLQSHIYIMQINGLDQSVKITLLSLA